MKYVFNIGNISNKNTIVFNLNCLPPRIFGISINFPCTKPSTKISYFIVHCLCENLLYFTTGFLYFILFYFIKYYFVIIYFVCWKRMENHKTVKEINHFNVFDIKKNVFIPKYKTILI